MPFYSCNVPAGSLTDDEKNDLAQKITRIHAEVTGAPPALVHVIYHELAAADNYAAGPSAGRRTNRTSHKPDAATARRPQVPH